MLNHVIYSTSVKKKYISNSRYTSFGKHHKVTTMKQIRRCICHGTLNIQSKNTQVKSQSCGTFFEVYSREILSYHFTEYIAALCVLWNGWWESWVTADGWLTLYCLIELKSFKFHYDPILHERAYWISLHYNYFSVVVKIYWIISKSTTTGFFHV